jgi:type II secretory pathway pseudopilin PulG
MSARKVQRLGFSLVEVVLAMGVVSFSVLATVALLSTANDTSRRARDEMSAAQLAENEFSRIRSLSAANFPINGYVARYFDANLKDLGTNPNPAAVYQFRIDLVPSPPPSPPPPTMLFNGEVRYPASAPEQNQEVVRFTTVMVVPRP